MKFLSALIVILLLISCKISIDKTNTAAFIPEVSLFMDKVHAAFKNGDWSTYISYLQKDGLYCGTDPKELWSLPEMSEYLLSGEETLEVDYTITDRKIMVSKSGNSALVTEQFNMQEMSARFPERLVTQVVRVENEWRINYFSFSLVPTNSDLSLIDSAFTILEQRQNLEYN